MLSELRIIQICATTCPEDGGVDEVYALTESGQVYSIVPQGKGSARKWEKLPDITDAKNRRED